MDARENRTRPRASNHAKGVDGSSSAVCAAPYGIEHNQQADGKYDHGEVRSGDLEGMCALGEGADCCLPQPDAQSERHNDRRGRDVRNQPHLEANHDMQSVDVVRGGAVGEALGERAGGRRGRVPDDELCRRVPLPRLRYYPPDRFHRLRE